MYPQKAGWTVKYTALIMACTCINHVSSTQVQFKIFLFTYLVAPGLSCGRQAPLLRLAGSLVVACELLVAACTWDLVPWPGIEPRPPAWGAWSPNHCTTREVPIQVQFKQHLSLMTLCKVGYFLFVSRIELYWITALTIIYNHMHVCV